MRYIQLQEQVTRGWTTHHCWLFVVGRWSQWYVVEEDAVKTQRPSEVGLEFHDAIGCETKTRRLGILVARTTHNSKAGYGSTMS